MRLAERLFEDWYPKDWRAMIALLASILGGGILTIFAWHVVDILNAYGNRLIDELVRDPNVKVAVGNNLNTVIDAIAWGMKLLLAGLITVILTLGFAINRRSIKLSRAGLDMEGGDGEPPPTKVEVVGTPDVKVANPPEDPAQVELPSAEKEELPPYAR